MSTEPAVKGAPRVLQIIVKILVAVFGSWSPPGWLRSIGRNVAAHKARSAVLVVALVGLGVAGQRIHTWYKNRPKPHAISWNVSSAPRGLPRFNNESIEGISIYFSGSVAPIANVDKVVTKGIALSPAVPGTWQWSGDRYLTFWPSLTEWPIDQKYTVTIVPKELLAEHVLVEKTKAEFATAPFTVALTDHKYYQDPLDESLKRVLVTFNFSHPVDTAAFEKLLKMHFVPSTADEKERDYEFEVSYERMNTVAFVKSKTLTLPAKNAELITTLLPGTKAKRGSPEWSKRLDAKTRVPGLYNFINIEEVATGVVDNERLEADLILFVSSNARIDAAEMKKNLKVWQLPLYTTDEEKSQQHAHRWADEEVDTSTLKKGDLVALTALPEKEDPSETHNYRYRADAGRYLYVQIEKGTKAFGGYVLGDTYQHVVRVPKAPSRVKLLHQGSLLALSGDHKVGAAVRDSPSVRYTIARFLPDQVHHLFAATRGSFEDPSFQYPFSEANFTETYSETHQTVAPLGKNFFDALDLTQYLTGGGGERRGLFIVKVQSWDEKRETFTGEADQRLLLVTDLGLLVKDAADGTHQALVQSIRTGEPVGGVKVQVVGRNGVPIESATTNALGTATLPSFADKAAEHQAVTYLAQKGRDMTLLPIGRNERYLNLSRFDAGGVHSDAAKSGMSAFVFSDRGIYRPGEELTFGILARNDDWAKSLAGVPLIFRLTDARGKVVVKQTVKASPSGFEELKWKSDETSPTGSYKLDVLLAENDAAIGTATVIVREFQPDRLKISVVLSKSNPEGWVKPEDIKAKVHLTNLFGTPATERKVKGSLSVTSGMPRFSKFRDYTFFDPLKPVAVAVDRMEEQTDEEGNAEFDLGASSYAEATYRLGFVAEGFEKEGGRSVSAEVGAWVSPLDYFVGYRSVQDLSFLKQNGEAEVELVAVGPNGKKINVKDLKLTQYEVRHLSVLVKQPDGTYRYESFEKEIEVSKKPLAISADGTKLKIATANGGNYVWRITNKAGQDVNHVSYTVAGAAATGERSLERSAQLQLNLKSKDVDNNQDLEIQVKAPYTGAGLITIEREKVYAHKWFKTKSATSIQSITVPGGLEGDAYVSVTFLRDAASPDVFLSPLSYGVVPFSISRAKRTAKLTLEATDKVKPGETVTMKVSADRPTRAIVFAIDEGILQVAHYGTPDPLKYFFQKRALGVQTLQILDLVLPDFSRLQKAYAAGGGDEDGDGIVDKADAAKKALGANLNPFKRKVPKPVAYWSGLIDVGTEPKELKYVVPDYFNGTLRVMMVAAAPDAIGAAERDTIVRGDFVLQPSAPLVVAPGDELEVPLQVANNVAGSGKKADVEVALQASKQFEIIGAATQKKTIGEMKEASVIWKLKATKALGSGTLTFTAKLGDKGGKASIDISVRPAAPYLVTVKGGRLQSGDAKLPIDRKLYPEFRDLTAGITYLPVGLSAGLQKYLEKFPHACTEQLTSQALPGIVLGAHPEFGFKVAELEQSMDVYYAALRARQNDNGAFGRWARNPRVDSHASLYATLALLEARDRGRVVPQDVLKSALAYAQTVAADTIETIADGRERAYAIYVLTRSGQVTAPLVSKLQKQLEKKFPKSWKSDLTAAYLGATLRLLKQDKLGEGMFAAVRLHDKTEADYEHYYDGLSRDAQVLYLMAKHFPERLPMLEMNEVESALKPIYDGGFNTYSAANAVMALEEYGRSAQKLRDDALAIAQVIGGQPKGIELPKSLLPFVPFDDAATALLFSNKGGVGAYWMATQAGFDVETSPKPVSQKIEVTRELTAEDGKALTSVNVGDEVIMTVRVRSLKGSVGQLAIVDLLPGGFEVVIDDGVAADDDDESPGDEPPADEYGDRDRDGEGEGDEGDGDPGPAAKDDGAGGNFSLPFLQGGSTFVPEYGDVREDRIVVYGSASENVETIVYRLKATTVGTFQLPPVQVSSMYDRSVFARSAAGTVKVVRK